MAHRTRRQGFNLLELMIVLVIMAAATAVVWPNLQKPLRRTSLTESASLVREFLDEARNQATQRGSACFVRLETGSNRLYLGTLQQFLDGGSLNFESATNTRFNSASQLAASDSSSAGVTGLGSRTNQEQSPQLQQLAGTVVVSDVRLSIASSQTSFVDPSSPASGAGSDAGAALDNVQQGDGLLAIEQRLESAVYWLPVLSSESGRDATITLYDTQLQDSIEIAFCAATGEIKILP